MQTPEPPNHNKNEVSPPQLSRPRCTTRSPSNYAQDQEIKKEQRMTCSQLKKKIYNKPATQYDTVTSDDSVVKSEDLNTAILIKELIKLR